LAPGKSEGVTELESAATEGTPPGKLWRRIVFTVLGAIIVYVALSLFGDISAVASALVRFRWTLVPAVLAFTLLNYAFRFVKWHYYLHVIDVSVGLRTSLVVFLSGLSMSVTPAKLGEVFKAYLLRRRVGTDISRVVPVVLAERVTDVLGLLVLASVSVSFFQHQMWAVVAMLAVVVALIAGLQSRRVSLRVIALTRKLPLLRKMSDGLETGYDSAYILFRWRPLLVALVISVVSWGFECLALYFVLEGLGTSASVPVSTFVFSFSSVAGAVSFLPGGMVVAEGSITGLLVAYDVSKDVAAGATIIIRFSTLWFGVLLGVLTLLCSGFRERARRT